MLHGFIIVLNTLVLFETEKCIVQALLSTNFSVKNDLLKKTKVSFSIVFAMFSFHCVTLWCLDVMSCFHVLYWIWHAQVKQRNAYRTSIGELHDMWKNMCNWLSENIHNILYRYMLYHFIFFFCPFLPSQSGQRVGPLANFEGRFLIHPATSLPPPCLQNTSLLFPYASRWEAQPKYQHEISWLASVISPECARSFPLCLPQNFE